MSFKKKIFSGVLANIFGQSSNIIIQIISVPIYISFWGTQLYGEWLLISSIPLYFSISDFGFSRVSANEMTMEMARKNVDSAVEIMHATQIFTLLISLILMVLTILSIITFDISKLLNIKYITIKEINFTIILFFIYISLTIQISVIEGVYRAIDRFAMGTYYVNIIRFIEQIGILVIVMLSRSILLVVVFMVFLRFIGLTLFYLYLQNINNKFNLSIRRKSLAKLKMLFSPSLSYSLIPIGNAMSLQLLRIIVGVNLGAIQLVVFTTIRMLTNVIKQIINLIIFSIWPEISRLFGLGKLQKIKYLHRLTISMSFYLTLIFVIILNFYGKTIFYLWTKNEIHFNEVLFLILLWSNLIYSIWYSSSIFPIAINKHKSISIYFFFGNLITIILSYLLLKKYDLVLLSILLFIFDIYMLIVSINTSMKILHDKLTYLFYNFSFIKMKKNTMELFNNEI